MVTGQLSIVCPLSTIECMIQRLIEVVVDIEFSLLKAIPPILVCNVVSAYSLLMVHETSAVTTTQVLYAHLG